MPHVLGLRSPYAKVGRLVFFGRMLDKIRLHAAGKLPPDYVANLGDQQPGMFDARCCSFLRVSHADLTARTLAGGTDADILAWAEAKGGRRTDEECCVWSHFMMKRGWRDEARARLQQRIAESALESKPIQTMFDYIDFDEGRDPVAHRAWEDRPATVVVLMGVAGSGKTTVGMKLAAALGWSFRDADDFHPPANVEKMSRGTPLTDRDRAPWLAAIREHIVATLARGESAVVTCSALKKAYRDALLPPDSHVKLVHLTGDYQVIHDRLADRQGHFMKPEMLRSQFETLETPQEALSIDIQQTPEAIVAEIRQHLGV